MMTVVDAWSLAEANHPRVVETRQRLTSLQRDVLQREAAYAPNVTVGATGLTLRVDRNGVVQKLDPEASVSAGLKLPSGLSVSASISATGNKLAADRSDAVRGNVSLSYPLLPAAAVDSDALALRQAETALTAAQREAERLRDEVRADVLAALHAEQVAAVRLELARNGHAEARQAWEAAQRRVEAGIATETELIGAQLDLLRAEQDDIVASRTWEVRQRQLADLLGLTNDIDAYEFESVLGWTELPAAGDLDEMTARAVGQSVAVWEAVQAEETARLQLAAERERSGFDARLEGGFRTTRSDDNSSSYEGWQIGLQVSYPLADGGQRRMTLESREEAYVRARETREAEEQTVREEVRELFYELEDALRAVEIAELELSRARLELAAVRRQADLPVATASEEAVQQSVRTVTGAELNRSEAVQHYQARWLALQRLQGEVRWHELVAPPAEAPVDDVYATANDVVRGREGSR